MPAASQTVRAARSLPSRLAPVAMMVLGLVYVGAAIVRLDDIYDGDAGILRVEQVTPLPLAAGGRMRHAVQEMRDEAAPGLDFDLAEALEDAAVRMVAGPGASAADADVDATSWPEGPDRTVAVAVVRLRSAEAGQQALVASAAPAAPVAGHPVAGTTWLAGRHLLVGVLVSSPDQAAALEHLGPVRSHVASYFSAARFLWFETVAVGPLLVLFVLWVSIRFTLAMAFFAAVAAVALAFMLLLIPVLILLVVAGFVGLLLHRGKPRVNRRPGDAPVTDHPAVAHRQVEAPSFWMPGQSERQAFLVVIVLTGFAIAAFTTSLFPESIGWGSLVLAAVSPAPSWARRFRHLSAVRKGLWILIGLSVGGLLSGLGAGLLGDSRFLVVLVPLGIALLVSHWLELTAGAELSYDRQYEEVDLRSTLFLAGAALLLLGAGSLFLASNGLLDVRGQLGHKAFAALGLLIALSASANVRASRDAARRDRARSRGTPPVLYLRSFGDDDLRVRSPRMQRAGVERLSWRGSEPFEDVIAQSLSAVGPVVAIAKPGTGQRDLGPARDSIVTDDWLGAVRTYMGEAALVAVVLGRSEGLILEFQTLAELGLLRELCIFVPPVDDEELAHRLAILQQLEFAGTWGPLEDARKRRILALVSVGSQEWVVMAPRRTAYAYRKCAADIAAAAAAQPAAPGDSAAATS